MRLPNGKRFDCDYSPGFGDRWFVQPLAVGDADRSIVIPYRQARF
jgi:hypothetical protein